MNQSLQKPTILKVKIVAKSRLFIIESLELKFSNGICRTYERMRPATYESVMIVPIIKNHLIMIREYAAGTNAYELSFPKGLINPGESMYEAANRELKEEVGFGSKKLLFLKKLNIAPSYLSNMINIMVAKDLYPEELRGDEPEPLLQIRWPLKHLMNLLEEPDFTEARNVSALFLVNEWLNKQNKL